MPRRKDKYSYDEGIDYDEDYEECDYYEDELEDSDCMSASQFQARCEEAVLGDGNGGFNRDLQKGELEHENMASLGGSLREMSIDTGEKKYRGREGDQSPSSSGQPTCSGIFSTVTILNECSKKKSLYQFFSHEDNENDAETYSMIGFKTLDQPWSYKNFYDTLPDDIEVFKFSGLSPDEISLLNRNTSIVINSKKRDGFFKTLDSEATTKVDTDPTSALEIAEVEKSSVIKSVEKKPFIAGRAKKASIAANVVGNIALKEKTGLTDDGDRKELKTTSKNEKESDFLVEGVNSKNRKNSNTKMKKAKILEGIENGELQRLNHINLVIIGHVDAGKSTVMGHLLYLHGDIEERLMAKYCHESMNAGKSSFRFAWILDESGEERKHGITIDLAIKEFKTDHREVTIFDAPGHRDFISNMISGTVQAEAAILVVDAAESNIQSTLKGKLTKEHIFLCRTFGIKQLIIAVNKLDLVEWSKERFDLVKSILLQILNSFGFKKLDICLVPISGLTGENLVESAKSPSLRAWYNGPTLLQAIDQLNPVKRYFDERIRMSIQDVLTSNNRIVTIFGKLESGIILRSEKVLICPANVSCTVKAIFQGDRDVEYAIAGSNFKLSLFGIQSSQIARGDILSDLNCSIRQDSVFVARIITFQIQTPILPGSELLLYLHQITELVTISSIISVSKGSEKKISYKPKAIFGESSALIEIKAERCLCFEVFKDFQAFGRFTLEDRGEVVASGIIEHVGPYSLLKK